MQQFFIKTFIVLIILGIVMLLVYSRETNDIDLMKYNKKTPFAIKVYAVIVIAWILISTVYFFSTAL
jgi:hypothetical protein